MKLLAIVTLTAAITATPTPNVQQIDLSSMTCQQFAQSDESRVDLIVTWFLGFYSEVHEPQVIDLGQFDDARAKFLNFCKQQPNFKLTAAADGLLGK
jgi:acid stress chaperone HdeB